jgi:hypothetical protein
VWDKNTGWVSWRRSDGAHLVSLCWLPVERRGKLFTWHHTKAAVASQEGVVTILDFSDVIAMLKGLDNASFK